MVFSTGRSFGQRSFEMKLWPDGAPENNGLTGEEIKSEGGRISNVTSPTITVFQPEQPNGMAIIMCPGGGYVRLAANHEGFDMAPWFNGMGITFIVLKYRMPNGHSSVPLSDAEQAVRMVRRHAAEWNVRPNCVGIMGASAGGHLAASLSTLYSDKEARPDFQILLYPVISMAPDITHAGSRNELIGENPSEKLQERFSLALHVCADTPQAFIALSADDSAVPPRNSLDYFSALIANKVPATIHIYPTGGHGWGFRDSFMYKEQWTGELAKWLKDGLTIKE